MAFEAHATVDSSVDVPVLVIALAADVGHDAPREAVARELAEAVRQAAEAHPDVELAVLDTTRAAGGLAAHLGKLIDWVPRGLAGRMWRWVAGDADRAALASWFGAETLAASVRAAIDELAAARRAGASWSERGYVETVPDDEGGSTRSLWFRGKLVERSQHGADGALAWLAFWPAPDALGHQSLASELGARVLVEGDVVRELDFLSAASDAEVRAAIARFPALRRLHLGDTRVTDALASDLAAGLAPELEELIVSGSAISDAARAHIEVARPSLVVR